MQKAIFKTGTLVYLFTFSAFMIAHSVTLASQPSKMNLERIQGIDLYTQQEITVSPSGEKNKGLVVLFLSARCPCSNSHVVELKKLSTEFTDFQFVAVHSNRDEPRDMVEKYFSTQELKFPILQDQKNKLADLYKAYKTPHSYVVLADGSVVYQGGVSSSHDFKSAEKNYLRSALEDIKNNIKVKTPEGRTLGCVISREDTE
jgi:peroxiredoxin